MISSITNQKLIGTRVLGRVLLRRICVATKVRSRNMGLLQIGRHVLLPSIVSPMLGEIYIGRPTLRQ